MVKSLILLFCLHTTTIMNIMVYRYLRRLHRYIPQHHFHHGMLRHQVLIARLLRHQVLVTWLLRHQMLITMGLLRHRVLMAISLRLRLLLIRILLDWAVPLVLLLWWFWSWEAFPFFFKEGSLMLILNVAFVSLSLNFVLF